MQSCMNGFGSITKLDLLFLSKSDDKIKKKVFFFTVVGSELYGTRNLLDCLTRFAAKGGGHFPKFVPGFREGVFGTLN